MKINKITLKWIAGVILLLTGLGAIGQGGFISAIFYMVGGLICLPPTFKIIEEKTKFSFQTWHKYAIVIGSLIIGGITVPKADKSAIQIGNNRGGESFNTETDQKEDKIAFDIEGEDIIIRSGAGNQFDKVVNAKATEALGKTEYCQVDYTTKVKILEESGEWTKIQVIEPEWLSSSHIGWIPTKNIIKTKENKILTELDISEYEIIKTKHNSNVQNFHVLVKKKNFDKEYLHEFAQRFRNKHCTTDCNLAMYDTKSIEPLIGIYPLGKKQYLEMADHLLSYSSFDAVEVKDWYPYQDFKYKEYGGKNWKKTPIK
jgi:hypothetical protein